MFYFARTPEWVKKLYTRCTWDLPGNQNEVYLTFDDGPHPTITPFVLNELKRYNAKATFFCIGKNAYQYPEVYKRILEEGHATGNHTQHHLNGWKTRDQTYLEDINTAEVYIHSDLFRPPYGRIKRSQLKLLMKEKPSLRVIMWSVLSGDFDTKITGENCLQKVLNNTGKGSIIVFHDSEKAEERLRYALPKTLEFLTGKGYLFKKIPAGNIY